MSNRSAGNGRPIRRRLGHAAYDGQTGASQRGLLERNPQSVLIFHRVLDTDDYPDVSAS
jgi:hypothetical protein